MSANKIERDSVLWNLWHGCKKTSEGCLNCYVYRRDEKHGKDSSITTKTKNFDLPLKKNRKGEYKVSSGTLVYTCFTSDFFLEDADIWREEAWHIIKERSDLNFLMITKRIDRFANCIPTDWGNGYDNVTICCTIENQKQTDFRLPIYRDAPIKHKVLICEPILELINLSVYSIGDWIEQVVVGGESGSNARVCDYQWIQNIRELCKMEQVDFWFKQTGAKFRKNGKIYSIPRHLQHSQARKANINLNYHGFSI